ncbi:putative acetyltransferase [Frankineae bacterium MT45]|nr:putative acetyltransferase [Frankineae bacterium MT45]
MSDDPIAIEDPRRPDIRALLERHLAFANLHSPPEDVYALDVDALLDPSISFYALRQDGQLLGVGALRQFDADHAEVKSMHVAAEARGQGAGRIIVNHLLGIARERGLRRVSLETGTMEAFAPARALYESAGFVECGPFGSYPPSPNSAFLTLALEPLEPLEPLERLERLEPQ